MNKQEVMSYLGNKFLTNGFKETVVNTPVGECYVTPCCYSTNPKDIDSIEYFLVSGPVPWLGGPDFSKVCEGISNMENLLTKLDNERDELEKYFEDNYGTENFDYSWYSDWYKDLYGFRPRNF